MHALNSRVKINWSALVCDIILKTTKLPMYPLPYALFLSKVFEYYNLNLVDEISITLTHTNIIEFNALHHMGFIFTGNGWIFKDEPHTEEKSPPPLFIDQSIQSDIQQSLVALSISIQHLDAKVTKLLKYHHIIDAVVKMLPNLSLILVKTTQLLKKITPWPMLLIVLLMLLLMTKTIPL